MLNVLIPPAENELRVGESGTTVHAVVALNAGESSLLAYLLACSAAISDTRWLSYSPRNISVSYKFPFRDQKQGEGRGGEHSFRLSLPKPGYRAGWRCRRGFRRCSRRLERTGELRRRRGAGDRARTASLTQDEKGKGQRRQWQWRRGGGERAG